MQQYSLKSREGKLILLATTLASGMAFFDGSTTGVALPTIQHFFHASITQVQWIVNAFALTLASLLLLSGSLGDRFGRKKIFSLGIGLFVLASIASALSHSVTQLVIFQAMQGLGAAMMIPGSLALINTSFEEGTRGKVIGLWAGYSAGIAASGPFLGGWLTQTFGWPSVWWINVPLGLIALFITLKFIPESRNQAAKKLDWFAAVLLAAGLFGLSYGLTQAPSNGWSHWHTGGSFVAGIVLLICFFLWERKMRNSEPLVPLQIFKSKLIVGANLVTLFVYFALSGLFFFLTLNLQQVQGYSPLLAGVAALPPILIITFLTGPTGGLSDRIGPRTQMIAGPALVASGMAALAFSGMNSNYWTHFFPGQVLFGLGMCLLIAPLTKSALSVTQDYSGAASGVNNAVSRIAAMLAIAVLGAVMLSVFTHNLSKNAAASSLSGDQQQQIISQSRKLGGIEIPQTFDSASADAAKTVVKQSFVYSFRWAMGINAVLCLLAAIIAAVTIKNPKPEPNPQ
jgi:EmrB/QacA subfamily drug resistance transporter